MTFLRHRISICGLKEHAGLAKTRMNKGGSRSHRHEVIGGLTTPVKLAYASRQDQDPLRSRGSPLLPSDQIDARGKPVPRTVFEVPDPFDP